MRTRHLLTATQIRARMRIHWRAASEARELAALSLVRSRTRAKLLRTATEHEALALECGEILGVQR